jgi:tRNA/rRNA methyltransferase
MLNDHELDRVYIVLVRARNPSNIGAVARAMHDFGFPRLRVVNPYPMPFEAAKSAVDASAVLAGAMPFTSVAEAVADCTLVVGTTAVGERNLQHELLHLPEAAVRIRAELRRAPMDLPDTLEPIDDGEAVMSGAPQGGRVALLFGSEKTGLSNEELSHCNWLLTIPMSEYADQRHPSMNLGQAVACCLYELVRDEVMPVAATTAENAPADRSAQLAQEPVTAAALERMTALLSEVLEEADYTRRHAACADPAHLRRLVRRIGVNAVDAPIWMGILRQILWRLGRLPED